MKKIGVREFRNQFCLIYKGRESYIVTKRGKTVGIYNPSGTMSIKCDREKFTGVRCTEEAAYFVKTSKEDYSAQGNLCVECYKKIKMQEAMDASLKLEERML